MKEAFPHMLSVSHSAQSALYWLNAERAPRGKWIWGSHLTQGKTARELA